MSAAEEEAAAPAPSRATYRRVLFFVTHYWLRWPGLLAGILAARIGSTLIDVSIPLASGHLIDAIASGSRDNPAPVVRALAIFIGLGALFALSRQIVGFLLNRLSARSITAIGRDAFAKVQRFSSEWHANSFAGSTVRKITRGMSAYDTFTDTIIFGLLPALIVMLGVSAIFAWRWPILGLIVAASIVIFLTVVISISVIYVQPANVAAREWDSRMSGTLADSITSNPAVKTFAAEEREDKLFADVAGNWEWRAIRSWDRGVLSGMVQSVLLVFLQIAMLSTGLKLWIDGQATPGDITTLITTQILLNGYLRDIGQHVRTIQRNVNDMDDVLEFRETDVQIADRPGAKPLAITRGKVEFDHVTFAYAGAGRALFRDLSVVIEPGQRVGLVGHSGAGKSTFVKLVQRLYDLQSGHIRIDGQDVAEVTQDSLRRGIGLVPQEPMLFHRSLAMNIAYGQPQASQNEIEQAAKLAHVDRFVGGLPKGYETLVGERGIKLSGGERQRVAIARAILAATPVLILDEATSSLDSVSELYIRDAIEKLSKGRTTLVIAHRLSTIQSMDRILVFDDGKIVEDGTHTELMGRHDGIYRQLLETQMRSGEIAAAAE
ncbi:MULTISPECIES: ABC transporter ATP-binding protein [unclassified Beijerinckia]|uniref:ABC transporter ATP-binding protein n=1 Tax=unclassified Beijerinckia TaxID=2638183 RepID=UPI00089B439A|nr:MULTISPECIES: ABC transporter ATP-binding protein [unclassified Beijerinckia]MDH7794626.1 ATP-binding cassette subfamily B protein [Beijerinckia sp. GAS462]SEB68986.1 ATP-binding cassette, subfamily B [Beijerinckia sp. 28-YEA-48]